VTLTLDAALVLQGYEFTNTHLFYGTMKELPLPIDGYECPPYSNILFFQHKETVAGITHEIIIPL